MHIGYYIFKLYTKIMKLPILHYIQYNLSASTFVFENQLKPTLYNMTYGILNPNVIVRDFISCFVNVGSVMKMLPLKKDAFIVKLTLLWPYNYVSINPLNTCKCWGFIWSLWVVGYFVNFRYYSRGDGLMLMMTKQLFLTIMFFFIQWSPK